jgi:hypothetical protein
MIAPEDEKEVVEEIARMSDEDRAAWALYLATVPGEAHRSAYIAHGDWTIRHWMHAKSKRCPDYLQGVTGYTTPCGWIGVDSGRQKVWRGALGEVRWNPEPPEMPRGDSPDDPRPDIYNVRQRKACDEWDARKTARREHETAVLLDTLTVRPTPILTLPPSVAQWLTEERKLHAEHCELWRQVAALPQLFIAV